MSGGSGRGASPIVTQPTETVRVAAIAAGGDGVARLADGRVVFVPRTAPGDVVTVSNTRLKRSFGRAEVVRLVESSPDRTEPRCRHYDGDGCGGCALQHVAYPAQVAAKAALVRDALTRIGRVAVPEFEIVPNPRPFGWRSRLSLSIDLRTGAAGLRRHGRAADVFPLVRCEIATPAVQRLWDALRPHLSHLPAGCERIALREARDGALHVVAHGVTSWPRADAVAASMAASGAAATLWIAPDQAPARVVCGDTGAAAATAFEQVDPAMGDAVRAHALSLAAELAGRHVWDLYAGTGETTSALAAAGATVESVESDPAAVAVARLRGPAAGVQRHTARVEDVLDRLADPALVIANPPRAGVGGPVTDAINARAVPAVVYVSCDPATLARDVARLSPRLRLTALRAFDSFPQTAHVETVALLRA